MNSIKEESIEKDALETLAKQGYQVIKSEVYNHTSKIIDAERNNDHTKFILEPRLAKVLKELNPGYSDDIYRRALHEFSKLADNPDMMINNHYMHKLLIEGVKIKTSENGENKTVTLHAIDFDNWENNDFLATNQFEIVQGEKSRRTDITVFVNGLPLITFELKKPDNENITVKEAYEQLQTYKAEIPDYMKYNEILIASDGVNARVGSLTAGFDRFMRWRQPKKELVPEGSLELDILIEYMLKPKTLLNIIQNFIIFETNGDSTVKILTAYHQYYMVNKAVVAAERALKSNSDKRIGVVWHTTGSGKSLSMVFFSGIVARKLGNPTILVINDRNDLDDQLFGTFAQAHEYLQQTPDHAENRDEVRDYMSRNSGGIVFSTIQKFSPDFERGENEMPVLTNRSDVIVMADEAHRTQYGLQAELTKNGVRYGYAKYLRDALPNASFIGFTGTPIDTADKSTVAVLGNYIDVYDITQSVADHATVRIFYESHIIPLKLKSGSEEKFNELMNEYDLNTEASDSEKEARNKELTKLEAIAGAKQRLEAIAKHFISHFEARQKEEFGKSMIVEISRINAVKLYNEIIKLRPNWESSDIHKGKIKIVMTSSPSDGPELSKHNTSKQDRRILQQRMKDNSDELQIVIVVDMWLTGFDVPSLNTLYVDKPMKGHNLIQAIARVNRVFKNKESGLIVDYIGIADSLKLALSIYSKDDKDQVGINVEKVLALLKDKYNIIKNDFLYGIDYSGFDSKDDIVRTRTVNKVANELIAEDKETIQKFCDVVTEAQKLYALVAIQPAAQEIGPEIAFFRLVKVFIMKLLSNNDDHERKNIDYRLRQMIDQSIIAEPEVDVYKSLGLEKPRLDTISPEFLKKVQNLNEKSLAVRILEKILRGQIKICLQMNIVQGKKFQEMLEASIAEYNKRGINTEIVIRELIEMAQKINAEQEKGKDLGLTPEEIAFYDALANHEKAVQVLGEEKLHLIAKELVKTVKANAGVDWERRAAVQAKMIMAVRHLLRKYGYPPDISADATKLVVSQAKQMAIGPI